MQTNLTPKQVSAIALCRAIVNDNNWPDLKLHLYEIAFSETSKEEDGVRIGFHRAIQSISELADMFEGKKDPELEKKNPSGDGDEEDPDGDNL